MGRSVLLLLGACTAAAVFALEASPGAPAIGVDSCSATDGIACSEEEAEMAEESFIQDMRKELVQTEAKVIKAGTKRRVAAVASPETDSARDGAEDAALAAAVSPVQR
mmetsp:Transcript_24789/g.57601  ORF Transcript_24789/g.57601 Transcript_24789/m.57601 type:complete len:108 (-) Transcript_24789:131-454(-)|eukprot:CAMPEP_0171069916 /NCGR_PEP_ID=MMETSP0766_2-20121228/9432_1 /TAXON_ID=439317 /ORGANISM="Gambierdiscus australes, Strain CAWD 149" /LENGTH=107 /DNA_ID=CAMNT_0011526335 /DNA_START=59 /DNA_END=382 /DNA_ORIENTATION=+